MFFDGDFWNMMEEFPMPVRLSRIIGPTEKVPSLTVRKRKNLVNPLKSLGLQAFIYRADMCCFFSFVLIFALTA